MRKLKKKNSINTFEKDNNLSQISRENPNEKYKDVYALILSRIEYSFNITEKYLIDHLIDLYNSFLKYKIKTVQLE